MANPTIGNRGRALEKGEKTYIAERPCSSGHTGPRYSKNAQCIECLKISKLKYKNSDKSKETVRLYNLNYQRVNKERQRAAFYGLTLEQFASMQSDQKGLCLICDNPFGDNPKNMHIDHCHSTGKVRGLLCHSCNIGLGKFKDDPELLTKAIEYLKRHGQYEH